MVTREQRPDKPEDRCGGWTAGRGRTPGVEVGLRIDGWQPSKGAGLFRNGTGSLWELRLGTLFAGTGLAAGTNSLGDNVVSSP